MNAVCKPNHAAHHFVNTHTQKNGGFFLKVFFSVILGELLYI